MRYINPYNLADFMNFPNLDLMTFKKFKKRLTAELELNDDKININNLLFQKNEIVETIDNIDRNKNLLEIYKILYENKQLNNFLIGESNIEMKNLANLLSLESKETIDFIMPYLIEILSNLYKKSFTNQEKSILEIEPPIEKIYFEKIYEPIYKILKNKENELLNLIKTKNYNLYSIQNIIGDIDSINSLPEYFSKIRGDIANLIRSFSIDSWNKKQDLDLALNLINYALEFNVNKKTKDKFLSDKKTLEEINIKLETNQEYKKTEKLNEITNSIERIFDSYNKLSFAFQINSVIDILRSNNIQNGNNEIAIRVFDIINNKMKKNYLKIDFYEEWHTAELIQIFTYLLSISNDYQFNKVLNKKLKTLKQIKEDKEKGIYYQKRANKFNNMLFIIWIIIIYLFGGLCSMFDN